MDTHPNNEHYKAYIADLEGRVIFLRGLLKEYYGWTLSQGECLFCDMAYVDGYHHENDCALAEEMDDSEGVE